MQPTGGLCGSSGRLKRGAAVWLVSLPFTLLAGNASEAAGTLIGGPVETTFMRCLGCRQPGYTGKDAKAIKKFEERKEADKDAEVAKY